MIIDQLNLIKATSERDSYDYLIAAYLSANWREVCQEKIQDVVTKLGVSKSTLSRFCKKLGHHNFTEVQYLLYYEMSYHQPQGLCPPLMEDTTSLKEALKGKQRLIVLGTASSLGCLLGYVEAFHEHQCDLLLQLNPGTVIDFLEGNEVGKDDLLIYVSLYKSDLELQIDYLGSYLEIVNWIRDHHQDYLYVGKVSNANEHHSHTIEIKANSIAEAIYQLCRFFETILRILD